MTEDEKNLIKEAIIEILPKFGYGESLEKVAQMIIDLIVQKNIEKALKK